MKKNPVITRESSAKATAFIVARLSSSRFPEKQFQLIGDKPLLSWITDNLRQCHEIDEIIITTVAEDANIPLRKFAQEKGVECFWYEGNANHVTTRLRKAAEKHNAEICVLISGDCPLIHPPAIDQMIRCLRENPTADIPRILPDRQGIFPALEGIAVARKKTWQTADDLSDSPELKEHLFPVISARLELFKTTDCILDEDLYFQKHRLSVDTWADLTFMNRLHDEITINRKQIFNLPNVLALLRRQPDLLKINNHVHQRGLTEKSARILFVVDAGTIFGYGHLMRSMELALQIIERLGWQVDFMLDDEKAARLVEDRGMRIFWGALGRKHGEQPAHRQGISNLLLENHYNLAVLDIYCRRNLLPGWQHQLSAETRLLVLNNAGAWAEEADLVIVPEVFEAKRLDNQKKGGLDHIIIRREIRYAKDDAGNKDINILAYIHLPEHAMLVKKIAEDKNLKLFMIDGFSPDFPNLLARSRFFVSGFGYSFYEALFLNTIPITLPASDAHLKAALFFYEQTGLPALIIDPAEDTAFWPTQADTLSLEVKLKDGTERIVAETAQLIREKIIS